MNRNVSNVDLQNSDKSNVHILTERAWPESEKDYFYPKKLEAWSFLIQLSNEICYFLQQRRDNDYSLHEKNFKNYPAEVFSLTVAIHAALEQILKETKT